MTKSSSPGGDGSDGGPAPLQNEAGAEFSQLYTLKNKLGDGMTANVYVAEDKKTGARRTSLPLARTAHARAQPRARGTPLAHSHAPLNHTRRRPRAQAS